MTRLGLSWDAAGELRIEIDGTELSELARTVELPFAQSEGSPGIAGAYGGLERFHLRHGLHAHLLAGPDSHLHCGPHDKTVLLACECGEPGCWPLMARIELGEDQVTWSDFEQPHRRDRWDYTGLGPLVFDRAQYEAALDGAG